MTKDKNIQGIVLMIFSMIAFAIADTLVKVATGFASPAQVLFFLIGGALIAFALMVKLQGEAMFPAKAFTPVLVTRYLSEIIGMVGMVNALAVVPLATVGAITQAAPMLVAVGAVLFLGEKVSWRRWTAIIIGFLGVLLIIQPGREGFEPSILWAILAMVALAIRDLTTRMVPPEMPSSVLATYTMMAATPFAVAWVLFNGESLFPADADWFLIIVMSFLGAVGYFLLITSIRMAEVSVVTPFRYSRIVILLIFGIVFFGEIPSLWVYIGAAMIILSGVYIVWREHQLKKLELKNTENALT